MKEGLDQYLEEAGLDGLIVIGAAARNPSMAYFTGLVHVGSGILARRRNSPAVLYCSDMERDEVARAGLHYNALDWAAFARQAGGDPLESEAIAFEHVLRDSHLLGRIQVQGQSEVGDAIETFRRLARRLPGLEIVAFPDSASPLARARATKDSFEVDRIRRMGAITVDVIDRVADFLTSHQARRGILVDRQGEALTIGVVKRRIDLWLAERGAENPEGTIFAVGHDAGVPHSTGIDDQPVPTGVPIVFDLFPCERGGGYFYDLTRTWCLDRASDDVARVYQDVLDAYRLGLAQARPGASGRELQWAVCELFEGRGHPSVLSTPGTRAGYVHSLGHGVGLAIHEAPWLTMLLEPPDLLQPGHVVTIEPGLYYPERGLGVRLEDTVWIGREGPEVLAPYPMDLVLPMRRSPRGQASKPSRSKKTKPRRTRAAGRAG